MRLPKRVPWASLAELDQVCSWIYSDESDNESRLLAVQRISAWRAITFLPHALESTLSLLIAILQDSQWSPSSSLSSTKQPFVSSLVLRQAYASAIIRLVNGLVDPLQFGAYARSIASIAAQLGLPLWLVELRHAATHEDLPSLELLRQAANESMTWLLHNYFMATINPSSTSTSTTALRPPPSLPTLFPILKRYKTLIKLTLRDTTQLKQLKDDIAAALRDVEGWLAEGMVHAGADSGGMLSWDTVSGGIDEDVRETYALEGLCDALLEKGGLSPLSKKKRIFPTDSFAPPKAAVALWTPLLEQVGADHVMFPVVLARRVVAFLLHVPDEAPATLDTDPSHDACLARWAYWILENHLSGAAAIVDRDETRRRIATELLTSLAPGTGLQTPVGRDRDRKAASSLLHALASDDAVISQACTSLAFTPGVLIPSKVWTAEDMSIMDARLKTLLALDSAPLSPPTDTLPSASSQEQSMPDAPLNGSENGHSHNDHDGQTSSVMQPAPGWRLLSDVAVSGGSAGGWKPCPIGVYYTSE